LVQEELDDAVESGLGGDTQGFCASGVLRFDGKFAGKVSQPQAIPLSLQIDPGESTGLDSSTVG
jgi:hypothetical protein